MSRREAAVSAASDSRPGATERSVHFLRVLTISVIFGRRIIASCPRGRQSFA